MKYLSSLNNGTSFIHYTTAFSGTSTLPWPLSKYFHEAMFLLSEFCQLRRLRSGCAGDTVSHHDIGFCCRPWCCKQYLDNVSATLLMNNGKIEQTIIIIITSIPISQYNHQAMLCRFGQRFLLSPSHRYSMYQLVAQLCSSLDRIYQPGRYLMFAISFPA